MKISELRIGQSKVDVEAEVISMEEPRSFNKFGRDIRVANAVVNDGSGEIKLTLWNTEIDNVKVGNKIKIANGFVNEFKGEKQLTAGKFGKLEVLGKGGEEGAEPKKEEKKSKKAKEEKAEKSSEAEVEEAAEADAEEAEVEDY